MTSPFSSPRPQYPQAPRGFQSPQPPNGSRSRMVLLLAGLIVVIVVAAVIVAALLFTRSSRTVSEPATTSGGARVTGTPNEASAPAAGAPSRAPSAPAQSAPGPTPTVESTSAPSVTDPTTLTAMHAEVTRDPNDPRAKGDVNAPVVMVIYSDFACPFCTRFAREVEPQLDDLVKNGTLRIEWRDLAQVTQTSPLAAQAGIAAGKQGKFWEFHDAVYGAADPQGHPEYTEDSLVDFAEKAGVPDLSSRNSGVGIAVQHYSIECLVFEHLFDTCNHLSGLYAVFAAARIEVEVRTRYAHFVEEDGIRDTVVTGVQTCLFRSWPCGSAAP